MKFANDFQADRAAPCSLHHVLGRLRVRSSRSLAEPCEGSLGPERGGGGHLSPRCPQTLRVLRKHHTCYFPLIFAAENVRLERDTGLTGADPRLSSLNLRGLRGRGQNCFVESEKSKLGSFESSPPVDSDKATHR
jgi:hypothetical protein